MREILLTSSVLILTVLLLRRIFRTTVSRRVQYALWALVLVRLLVPGSLPAVDFSVLSVSEPVQEQLEARWERREALPPETLKRPTETRPPVSDSTPAAEESAPEVQRAAIDLAGAAALVWKVGAAVMACWLVWSNLRFWQKLRRARVPLDIPDCSCPVYLVEEGLHSPCLFGLLRPAIYLTPAAAASPAALRHVLAHEETHARHLDPLWALLRSVCLAIYWFDPLVWWAAAASRTDCELACDEGALARLGEAERIPYGKTLLALVPVKRGPENPMLSATTMTAGKKRLKERVTRIAENRKCGVLALCVLLVLVLAACAATFTGGTEVPKSDTPASGPVKEPAAAPSVADREPVLTVPLNAQPYVPTGSEVVNPDVGYMSQDTVSVDTMGEVLADKTISDGTRIVCYRDPGDEYIKFWAIREGDTLRQFYKENSGYSHDYDVGEYSDLFGHDGFILYAPRGGAYFAIDYWYLDDDGTPRILADCANEVIRGDWNGDGEDDLMWFYHDSPYLFFQRDGVLCIAGLLGAVEKAWPEVSGISYDIPENVGNIRICGYIEVPSEVLEGFSPLCAPRDLFIQGDYINLYKDPEPAVTDHVYDGIDVPEEVLEAAKHVASDHFQGWRKENPGDFDDWRISCLERVEEPSVSRVLSAGEVEVYDLLWELHAASPGDVIQAGGTTVYEDGWVNGFYTEQRWLLFRVKSGRRELLDVNITRDAYPDTNAFRAEYAWALTRAGVLKPSELESKSLYLAFYWVPFRFLEDLAEQSAEEQDAALKKLTDYIRSAVPIGDTGFRSDAMAHIYPGSLSAAAQALYDRLLAGVEEPIVYPYTEDTLNKEIVLGIIGGGDIEYVSGSASIDPLDYGITPAMLSFEEEPDWEKMGIGALCAYYLNSDGTGAEGSSDELYHRFLNSPGEVLAHLAALGDQAGPRSSMTAAEELCRAIASADVFWYDAPEEFAAVMEKARETYPDGPMGTLLDTIQAEHDDALSRW